MSLQFIDPVDTRFNILAPNRKRRDFLQHDFEIEKKDQLILVKISPIENEQSLIQFPHLEFTRMLNHVASNDPESQIYIYDLPRDKGIDWMTEARFTPKNSLSEWEYGTVKSYFKEELGMISVIYLDKRIQARFEPYVAFIPEITPSNNHP